MGFVTASKWVLQRTILITGQFRECVSLKLRTTKLTADVQAVTLRASHIAQVSAHQVLCSAAQPGKACLPTMQHGSERTVKRRGKGRLPLAAPSSPTCI